MTKEGLQKVREALVANIIGASGRTPMTHEAIAIIDTALAQTEQEPVLWADEKSKHMWGKSDESGHPFHIITKGKKVRSHQIPLYAAPVAQPNQMLVEALNIVLNNSYDGPLHESYRVKARAALAAVGDK